MMPMRPGAAFSSGKRPIRLRTRYRTMSASAVLRRLAPLLDSSLPATSKNARGPNTCGRRLVKCLDSSINATSKEARGTAAVLHKLAAFWMGHAVHAACRLDYTGQDRKG